MVTLCFHFPQVGAKKSVIGGLTTAAIKFTALRSMKQLPNINWLYTIGFNEFFLFVFCFAFQASKYTNS